MGSSGAQQEMATLGPGTPRNDRSLAVDFSNTIACPGCRAQDAFATRESARRWLRARVSVVASAWGPPEWAGLREFREDVRTLLRAAATGSRPPADALDSVNRALKGASPVALGYRGGRWSLARARGRPGPTADLRVRIARSTAETLAGSDRPRVRLCQAPGCLHLLFARSSRQLWCSPTGCGNRVRVQRHYRRSRGAPA